MAPTGKEGKLPSTRVKKRNREGEGEELHVAPSKQRRTGTDSDVNEDPVSGSSVEMWHELDPFTVGFWHEGIKILGITSKPNMTHLYGSRTQHRERIPKYQDVLARIDRLSDDGLVGMLRSYIHPDRYPSFPQLPAFSQDLRDLWEEWSTLMPPKDKFEGRSSLAYIRSHICYELWGKMVTRNLLGRVLG